MTKSNNGPFTHHERLRYSYLLKNLAYLNGQQASEFNYLQSKLDAYEAERSYGRYQEQREDDYQAAWRQPYDNRRESYQEPDYENVHQLTDEGLPIYQEETPQSRPERKKFLKKDVLSQKLLLNQALNQLRRSDQRKSEDSRKSLS